MLFRSATTYNTSPSISVSSKDVFYKLTYSTKPTNSAVYSINGTSPPISVTILFDNIGTAQSLVSASGGVPPSSGTLTKISGSGPSSLTYSASAATNTVTLSSPINGFTSPGTISFSYPITDSGLENKIGVIKVDTTSQFGNSAIEKVSTKMEAGALTGKLLNVRRLTGGTLASPSTYTPTTGTKAIIVEVVGGGGGGGGANLVASAGLNTVGAGGGGGGYAKAFKVISFGEVFTYYAPVTGTGGTAGGITGTDGTAGETASFMCSVGSGSVTGTGGGFGNGMATGGTNAVVTGVVGGVNTCDPIAVLEV